MYCSSCTFKNSFLILFEKKARNDALKMPSNSLPDADLNLPEMKTKSSSCLSAGVHMYEDAHGYLDVMLA